MKSSAQLCYNLCMKKILFLLLFSLPLWAQQKSEWVTLGQSDFSEGYKTLYRLYLEVPKGVHDADDIKKGMQVMQFRIQWLPPKTDQQTAQSHFKSLLEAQFENPEDLKFNQTILNRLYKKLPEAKRHDEWVFKYSPEAGTQLFIKGKKIHSMIGSEANSALHHAWLLQSPVVTAKLMNRLLKAKQR